MRIAKNFTDQQVRELLWFLKSKSFKPKELPLNNSQWNSVKKFLLRKLEQDHQMITIINSNNEVHFNALFYLFYSILIFFFF